MDNNKEIDELDNKDNKKIDDNLARKKNFIQKAIFTFLIALLAIATIVGINIIKIASKVDKKTVTGIEEAPKVSQDIIKKYSLVTSSNSLGIPEFYQENIIPNKKRKGIKNTLIIGTKNIDGEDKVDILMILSIDPLDKKLKLSSFLTQTLVFVPDKGEVPLKDIFNLKKPDLTMFTINSNFALNIKDYIAFDIDDMFSLIDRFDGTDIGLNREEGARFSLSHGHYNLKHELIREYYYLELDGEDFTGTLRKKRVLSSFLETLRQQNSSDIGKLLEEILPKIRTTYTTGELLDILLKSSIERYPVESDYFPKEKNGYFTGEDKKIFIANIPLVKEKIVDFIFGEDILIETINYMDPLREMLPNDSNFLRY